MRCLFVGAHPDDIEIGAGALARRLALAGHEVRFLILTDHVATGRERRQEALAAASRLGIEASSFIFLMQVDGRLGADAPTVGRVREVLEVSDRRPQLVIAHTSADSHNDHRAANSLVRAAFRQSVMLFYSIHVSSEIAQFTPQFFVELGKDELKAKVAALSEHATQRRTIARSALENYELSMGHHAALSRCESFEVEFQVGADERVLGELMLLNDSPFHRLWSQLIGVEPIYLLHEDFDATYPIDSHESLGRQTLRDAFLEKWVSYPRKRLPLIERFSNTPEAIALMKAEHVLLAGGCVSNTVYRNRFIRTTGVDWIVEYELPDGPTAFLQRRSTGEIVMPASTEWDWWLTSRCSRCCGIPRSTGSGSSPAPALMGRAPEPSWPFWPNQRHVRRCCRG